LPQIIRLTSEALQASIRRLLPSQQGFGLDLEATNVITPIIDLTPTAEGSELRQDLQSALAYGSNTEFSVGNTSTALSVGTGFIRIAGVVSVSTRTASATTGSIDLTGSGSAKSVWGVNYPATTASDPDSVAFDFVVYVLSGEGITITSGAGTHFTGNFRQIADLNGELVNPNGYNPQ